MTKTIINSNVHQPVVGYMCNTTFSYANEQYLAIVQQDLAKHIGSALWLQPRESLHITLYDWIAPLVNYAQDKDELFQQVRTEYDHILTEALRDTGSITVKFDTIKVGPAAVWIEGHDNGEFASIRKYFLDHATLLPNTKSPPTIIHSTLGRFVQEVELESLEPIIKDTQISLEQVIGNFRLVRETLDPMLEFEGIEKYMLQEGDQTA